MDEFITFIGDRNSPTAPILAFMQEAATEFCSKLIGCVATFLFQSFRYSVEATMREDAVFKGRQFDRSVILLCVRWYLAYNLSLRNLEEMMAERGISVDHATVHRWVVRYSSELLERFNRRKRAVTGKWHIDETTSRPVEGGCTCTGPSAATATRLSFGSASDAIWLQPSAFCARRSYGMAVPRGSLSTAARPIAK